MQTHYSLIAGRSLERLSALSDGIFAVAMTLLVLELHVPVFDAVHTRVLAWIHIGFLCAVTLLPFSTSLLAQFITYRLALGVYWLNLLLLGVLLMASIWYAARAGLLREELPPQARLVHSRRIVSYQVLYALAFLLSAINTYISIGVLIGLQFHSILGMELPFVRRGLILAAS